jgi:hypothetical protein
MTTGAKHKRLIEVAVAAVGGEERHYHAPCRCAIGVDHDASEITISQFDPDEDEDSEEGESLSVYEAAEIWRSHGEDGGYTFGYSDDELRRAADED